jgi:hypothetical protein
VFAPAIVVGVDGAIVLTFPLAFAAVVGGGGRRGRGHRRTRQFLLRWAQWLLLRRTSSSRGHGVEYGGLSLGRRVVQLDPLEFEVIADDVEGGERLLDEDLHVIEPLIQSL